MMNEDDFGVVFSCCVPPTVAVVVRVSSCLLDHQIRLQDY